MPLNLHLRREIVPAILFASIPLLCLAGITVLQLLNNVPNARAARENAVRSFDVIRTINAVDEAVQDAERGQRGFLITGRDDYLQPYNIAVEQLPSLMDHLHEVTSNSPSQRARLLKLQAAITTKINELAATIKAMREHGYEAAKEIVNTDVGRTSMDAVRVNLVAIDDDADQRLRIRLAGAESAEYRMTLTFIASSFLAALALLAGSLLLARAYNRAASSEQFLQATLDSVREGVAAFDSQGHLRAWNQSFAKILNLDAATFRVDAAAPEASPQAKEFHNYLPELDVAARRTGGGALVEKKLKDGSSLEIFLNQTPDGGRVTTILDITERKQSEDAFRQAQRLESVGKMTGGVAHDFNNLLTVIIGCMSLIRRSIERDQKAIERVDMATMAAERGARLTKQLLAFARRQPLQPEIVNLGNVMQEILPLVRRAVGEEIVVECVTGGGLWNANVDAAQFQSAILNLAINSRDAMPEGGKLTIEVQNTALDEGYAARHAEVEPGQYVLFAITDTGKGMDQTTMSRALDPFFTTKSPGEGTGLGLPQVFGFVKQSGGHLKVYSEVGEGTTVKMYLPRILGQVSIQPHRGPALALTGTETVLLVDDDEIVRTTVAAMLEDLGYKLLLASNGAEAITILESGQTIDLLFTDVVMPGVIGGRKLAERAAEIIPGIKVLFTSGYTENAIVHNGRLDHGVELLSKPYDREKLAAKVRRVLDSVHRHADESKKA